MKQFLQNGHDRIMIAKQPVLVRSFKLRANNTKCYLFRRAIGQSWTGCDRDITASTKSPVGQLDLVLNELNVQCVWTINLNRCTPKLNCIFFDIALNHMHIYVQLVRTRAQSVSCCPLRPSYRQCISMYIASLSRKSLLCNILHELEQQFSVSPPENVEMFIYV